MIRPTVPCPFISTPSYSCCAILIVFEIGKLSAFEASCCNVLVVNGRGAFFVLSPFFISRISNFSFSSSARTLSISSFDEIAILSLPFPINLAMSGFFSPSAFKDTSSDQYSSGINALISSSRSQTILSATDCTLPALKPLFTFAQSNGLIL